MSQPFDLSVVDRWSTDITAEILPAGVVAYAEAIGDPSGALSPIYAVVPAMPLVFQVAEAACPPDLRHRVVHGQQDMLLHRPLPLGDTVTLRAAVVGLHGKPSGTTATIKVETRGPDGMLLNEQYVTEFYRGIATDLAVGTAAPPTGLPKEPPAGEPAATATVQLAATLPVRYAEASGDHNPIHLDNEFARAAGLPGVIVHGLCTLAVAVRTVIDVAGTIELSRLSARFTRPITPEESLTTRVFRHGMGFRFDCVDSHGQTVIGAGLAEIR